MSEYDELVKRLNDAVEGVNGLFEEPDNPEVILIKELQEAAAKAAQAIERLEAEVGRIYETNSRNATLLRKAERELAEARAREKLKDKALTFYANRNTWKGEFPDRPIDEDCDGDFVAVSGRRAREALTAPGPKPKQEKCNFPDCGCAEARLCMFPPANDGAMAWNLPKRK